MLTIGPYKINNPYILAPMAGVSQMPFRRLALKMGAGLAPTELISAKGLFFSNARTKSYLRYDKDIEKPFSVQLFGGEAEAMAAAAKKAVEMGADIIDINMGCPVKKVTKTNAGSALLCDYKRAVSIVQAMKIATDEKIPITAKIRSGWDEHNLNFVEVAKALADAGIAAIALHARTRAQGYSGKARLEHIAELKSHLKIPVIGNGDVNSIEDAKKMLKQTKCDAIMVGRAALGNPWIFGELNQDKKLSITSDQRLRVIKEHLADHIELQREIADSEKRSFNMIAAIKNFRSHLLWYSKGLYNGAKFRQQVVNIECPIELDDLIINFFTNSAIFNDENIDNDEGIDYRQAFG